MPSFEKWREALQLAPDPPSVIAILGNYREALRPVMAVLPSECASAIETEAEIQEAAVTLLRAELCFDGPQDVRKLLHEAAHTFASAAVRLTMLHTRPAPGDGASTLCGNC